MGQEPVIIQPASTTAFKMASQLAVVLLAKTMVPTPFGSKHAPAFAESFGQLPFVKRNVVRRVAQLVRTVNDDFLIFWDDVRLNKSG